MFKIHQTQKYNREYLQILFNYIFPWSVGKIFSNIILSSLLSIARVKERIKLSLLLVAAPILGPIHRRLDLYLVGFARSQWLANHHFL